jgi:chromosome segregation protein
MKIKKLDIIGFKSFIDKVTLTFPDGVTAIVGPNGSGKSNLMDAIKWALGEQSVKSLRGKSMEDVIFNGSREKKPLGMAEVTLTFGGVDGGLPHGFSHYHEITVRRRIYRSGESEYFLNKTPCRLRDITDLFLGTGVGSKTYSMIAQGQIGDLITARPIDRRAIIEEAAGISKYKAKKLESQRKMEATQTNLVRIGDIIGEVKRQMDSLAHQAKKAEEYKVLKAEVKRLELIAAARGFSSLSSRIDEMGRALSQKELDETGLSTRVSVLDGTIEEQKTAALEKEEGFSEIQRRFFSNETDIKTLEQSIGHLKERIALTEDRNKALARDIEGLSALVEEARGRTEEIEKEIAGYDGEVASHRQALEGVEASIDSLGAVIDDLSGKWEALRDEQVACASRAAGLVNAIASSEKWIERTRQETEKKRGRMASLSEEIAATEAGIAAGTAEKGRTEAQHKTAADAVAGAAGDVTRLEEDEARLVREHQEAEAEKQRAAVRNTSLEEMEKNLEGLAEGTKSVMSGDRAGVLGILVDFIESDERHERALEGYLGEAVSAVLVSDLADAKNHVDRLKASGAGRAVFVPVGSIPRGEPKRLSGDGVIGRLADHLTVKGPNAAALSAVLSGAYLVSDLGRAVDIWKKERPDAALVTLEGDVLSREGIVFGGGSRDREFSVIRNKREKKTLAAELEKFERLTREKADRLEKARQALAARRNEHKGLQERVSGLAAAMNDAERELAARERDRERLSDTMRTIMGEIGHDEAETERLKREIEDSMLQVTEAEKKEEELKNRAEGLKSTLSERQREMGALRDRETETRLALNSAQDNKRHLLASLSEYRRQIERSQEERENKEAAIKSGAAEIEQHHRRITETEQELSAAIERAAEIENLMHNARSEHDLALVRQRELDEEKKHIQRDLSSLREEIVRRRDEIKELSWEKENLVTRVQERHHENLTEVYAHYLPDEITDEALKDQLEAHRRKVDRLGDVNLMALSEYNTLAERHEFLKTQETDLVTSLESLVNTIKRIDRKSRERFMAAFEEIDGKFKDVFARLLPGGRARLVLTDEEDPLESGIDIMAQPPGRRLASITLLSGGEKALTAISLVFAIFMVKPTPFCMMDEVDAPLDDINTERIIDLLKEISLSSQVILITHNKKTMEMADTLYGITMEEPGVSKTVSVKLTS